MEDFQQYESTLTETMPEAFRQEIKEYIGMLPVEQDDEKFLGQEFNSIE